MNCACLAGELTGAHGVFDMCGIGHFGLDDHARVRVRIEYGERKALSGN